MKETKYKYQQEYVNTIGCFWGTQPAKYVNTIAEMLSFNLSGLAILDLGAGEGKNAVYLSNLGATVTAVDVSKIALSKFSLQPDYGKCSDRITTVNNDILDLTFPIQRFDIIIAYGILHSLNSKADIYRMIERIKLWTKKGGYFVAATFTDLIPPPSIQEYLDVESFLKQGELQDLFRTWKIINSEDGIIKETHPTSKIEHEHSITRIIAKND